MGPPTIKEANRLVKGLFAKEKPFEGEEPAIPLLSSKSSIFDKRNIQLQRTKSTSKLHSRQSPIKNLEQSDSTLQFLPKVRKSIPSSQVSINRAASKHSSRNMMIRLTALPSQQSQQEAASTRMKSRLKDDWVYPQGVHSHFSSRNQSNSHRVSQSSIQRDQGAKNKNRAFAAFINEIKAVERIEKESTRDANKKSKELMEDVRMFQHKYLPPKRVLTRAMQVETDQFKHQAIKVFKKEKRNFKYDSQRLSTKRRKDGAGKGGVPMKSLMKDSAIKQAGYFANSPSQKAIQHLNSILKLSVGSAATYGDEIKKRLETERRIEESSILNRDLGLI